FTKAIPKKAANSKAHAKPRTAAVCRTNFVTTNGVERAKSDADSDYKALMAPEGDAPTLARLTLSIDAESDADSEAPMVPEGSAPTLAPIFNATPRKARKIKTVEKFYQKKTQLESILLRPDTHIGSTEMIIQWQWIYNDTMDSLIEKDIQFVPGFFKIFDEVLVNAANNKIWDPTMSKIKVTIDPKQNLISVCNNGSGIRVELHKEEKVYILELIFGHLLTSLLNKRIH
ncbi:hypothetical protein L0F63_004978, partial [Massospora cicadina]